MRRTLLLALAAVVAGAAFTLPGHHFFGGPARSGSLLIAGITRAL